MGGGGGQRGRVGGGSSFGMPKMIHLVSNKSGARAHTRGWRRTHANEIGGKCGSRPRQAVRLQWIIKNMVASAPTNMSTRLRQAKMVTPTYTDGIAIRHHLGPQSEARKFSVSCNGKGNAHRSRLVDLCTKGDALNERKDSKSQGVGRPLLRMWLGPVLGGLALGVSRSRPEFDQKQEHQVAPRCPSQQPSCATQRTGQRQSRVGRTWRAR